MGLDRLFRGLYGPVPQIDIEKQIARARVPSPQRLDFAALEAGLKRNNLDVAGIVVLAEVSVGEGRVTFAGTDQSFPLEGAGEGGRRGMRVRHWKDPAKTSLEILPARAEP